MRQNTPAFDAYMQAPNKSVRLVVELGFPTPWYLTSHDDIPGMPTETIQGVLDKVKTASQSLKPLEGRALIGRMSFEAIDAAGQVTTLIRDQELAGVGLKGTRVRLWHGGAGMDFSDFRLESTQRIEDSVKAKFGRYSLRCQDIQRGLRKEMFRIATTRLAVSLTETDDDIQLYDASEFQPCTHVASFTDAPSGSYVYLKIKDGGNFEIVRCTTRTGDTFTSVSRGVLGTTAREWTIPDDADEDNSIEVEEYVYLELPAPAMIQALLTGTMPGGVGTLPDNWVLDLADTDLDVDAIANVGADLFDSTDYTRGLILRAQGVTSQDGKKFIEREILSLAGLFAPVLPDGRLSLKRLPNVQRDADYHVRLDNNQWVRHGGLSHDLSAIRNKFEINWAYVELPGMERPQYLRKNTLADAISIALYGEQPTEVRSFQLLSNFIHTSSTIQSRVNYMRDLKSGPPLSLTVEPLPSCDDIEIGDVVRMVDVHTRDYQSNGTLDRSMLVVDRATDPTIGKVSLKLWGSARQATPQGDTGATVAGFELPDGAYDAILVPLDDWPGVSITNGQLDASATVDLSALAGRTQFRVPSNFTVPAGMTLEFIGHVELWVKGFLTVNGEIRLSGGNPPGVAGYLGTTFGGRRKLIGVSAEDAGTAPGAPRVEGANQQMPVLEIVNDAGTLRGIPDDMGGSGGGAGGGVWRLLEGEWSLVTNGGAGGAGGGSIVTVSRGVGFGAAGSIDMSGEDGSVGGVTGSHIAGSGGGGAPGCALFLIDGVTSSYPILTDGRVKAEYGISPANNGDETVRGKATAALNLGSSAARVEFVPVSREPYQEEWTNVGGSSVPGPPGPGQFATYNEAPRGSPPSPPTGDGESNGWSSTLTSLSNWVSYKQAQNVAAGSWSVVYELGASGVDGAEPLFVYRRAISQPLTPAGNPPPEWVSNPALATGTGPIWVSTNRELGNGTLVGAWSAPVQWNGIDGQNGNDGTTPIFVYKQFPTEPERPTGNPPGDSWFPTPDLVVGSGPTWVSTNSIDSTGALVGAYSLPARFTALDGEQGDQGDPGVGGNTPIVVFTRSFTTPPAPAGNPVASPWVYDPGLLNPLDGPVWYSVNEQLPGGQLVGAYSGVAQLGGDGGLSAYLTRPQIILNRDGNTIDYNNAVSRWVVKLGVIDVTDQGSYSLDPEVGVTMTISADGEIRITGVNTAQAGSTFEITTQVLYAGQSLELPILVQVNDVAVPLDPSVSITPTTATFAGLNGTYDTNFQATAANNTGTPTFTFALVDVVGSLSITSQSGNQCTVRSTGTNAVNTCRVRCTMQVDGQTIVSTTGTKQFGHFSEN